MSYLTGIMSIDPHGSQLRIELARMFSIFHASMVIYRQIVAKYPPP